MARRTIIVLGSFSHPAELSFEFLKLLVRKLLEIDKLIARVFDRTNQFVQFEMHCFSVTVLRVLNQKYHQERDDGRGGVDDELPGVGKMKGRAGNEPNEDHKNSSGKCPCTAEHHGGTAREDTERVTDDTKEIAFLLVLF